MVLIIDPQIAGISGDMMLSSLVHLGANKSKIISGVSASQNFLQGSKIKKIDFKKVNKHGIQAMSLVLQIGEHSHERKGIEIQNCIKKTADKIGLSESAKTFAANSIATLIKAESKIHGVPTDSVHFHEASSIDTVIDIVGTAIALDDLNCFDEEIITTPVSVGSGTVTFSHGTVSNPAGAILEIFDKSKILISGSNVKDELTTPTGASILVNLADRCSEFYPMMNIKSIGYGAGQKNFDGFSNVLKIIRGESAKNTKLDSVTILETNVDDISGEVLAHVIDKIMANGAKDVSVIQTITKKGRPSHMISVICDSDSVSQLLNLLVSETGTLGVRIRTSDRFLVPRQIITMKVKINNKIFTLRCKVASTDSHKQFKVEYDDIKSISEKLALSFKQTEELIKAEVKKQLK
ncbi:nickel pincer cofactor biosynthesis protein LarC [Candidatus Nitrosotenuis sp. DW1]|uniref:nickel pincer cofactor biosynthesis protein LarC n=1 Tax=Candidatus Nitrosotenuis sp. DW1 TaxID=2259672 RepID=UPI0015CBDE32|nr:nickel pincer cofactor biosynthesis protein LarC [Candidatus Nitrosotenuis sp. DW1]QLH08395.1 nickel pincer cofactor biosynthesis protein LarC [Candidatus Nitrosotenuis sp. DW1]